MIRKPRNAVRHLHTVPRPYDHERDDDGISVTLSAVRWSALVRGAQLSNFAASHEVAAEVAAEVRKVQHLRQQAMIADAEYELETECAYDLPDGA